MHAIRVATVNDLRLNEEEEPYTVPVAMSAVVDMSGSKSPFFR